MCVWRSLSNRFGRTMSVLVVVLSVACTASAQRTRFDNASLQGTYAFHLVASGPELPRIDMFNAGMVYFDGAGNHRAVFYITNFPGEPEASGHRQRDSVRNVSDPSSWTYIGTENPAGRYAVTPFGVFTFTLFSTIDGLPIRVERIDDAWIITEYRLFARTANPVTGNVNVWTARRLSDENLLPPVPGADP